MIAATLPRMTREEAQLTFDWFEASAINDDAIWTELADEMYKRSTLPNGWGITSGDYLLLSYIARHHALAVLSQERDVGDGVWLIMWIGIVLLAMLALYGTFIWSMR